MGPSPPLPAAARLGPARAGPRAAVALGGLLVAWASSCAAGPPLSLDAAGFEALHRPVVFLPNQPDLDRDELWQALAASFEGDELTRQYVDHRVARATLAREGTTVVVRSLSYDELTLEPGDSGQVAVIATWSVGGLVTHRGHEHPRVNRYRAVFLVEDTPGGPRMVATRMADMARVRLRGDERARQGEVGALLSPLDLLDLAPAGEGDVEDARAPDAGRAP